MHPNKEKVMHMKHRARDIELLIAIYSTYRVALCTMINIKQIYNAKRGNDGLQID